MVVLHCTNINAMSARHRADANTTLVKNFQKEAVGYY